MKSIFPSIVFIALFASSAFSQGPAKGAIVPKRTVIKDSLGKTIKLSECTEKLQSGNWILHLEKNEQGKPLYLLLKGTTAEEKQLLSDDMVSGIQQEQFEKIKRGRFILTSPNGDETRIRRRGNKQVECVKRADGSKQKTKYRIFWLEDASYILKPWDKVSEMAKTPRYKITEITDEYYAIRVVETSFLGPVVKVYSR